MLLHGSRHRQVLYGHLCDIYSESVATSHDNFLERILCICAASDRMDFLPSSGSTTHRSPGGTEKGSHAISTRTGSCEKEVIASVM